MSRRSAVTAQPCTVCGAAVRTSAPTPICSADMDLAERAFRREHSPRDRDWLVSRNRFFGRSEALVAAIRSERAAVAV